MDEPSARRPAVLRPASRSSSVDFLARVRCAKGQHETHAHTAADSPHLAVHASSRPTHTLHQLCHFQATPPPTLPLPAARGSHERRQLLRRHVPAHIVQQRLPAARTPPPRPHFVRDLAENDRLLLPAAPLAHRACTKREAACGREGCAKQSSTTACSIARRAAGVMLGFNGTSMPACRQCTTAAPEDTEGEPPPASLDSCASTSKL